MLLQEAKLRAEELSGQAEGNMAAQQQAEELRQQNDELQRFADRGVALLSLPVGWSVQAGCLHFHPASVRGLPALPRHCSIWCLLTAGSPRHHSIAL